MVTRSQSSRSTGVKRSKSKTDPGTKGDTKFKPYTPKGTRRKADAEFVPHPPSGRNSTRRWVDGQATNDTSHMSSQINVFVQGLANAASESATFVPCIKSLVDQSSDRNGFIDDSLPSIVERCRLAGQCTVSSEFLFMVHFLQLVFKCSRWVK